MIFRSRPRPLDEQLAQARERLTEVIARESEERAAELARTLSLVRAETLAQIVDEERRVVDERRRDVAERERDASIRLNEALAVVERRVEERLAQWSAEMEAAQESIAADITRITQSIGQLGTDLEEKVAKESMRLATMLEDQRTVVGRVRADVERSASEMAKAAAAELEQHAVDRRRALHEIGERLRRREHDLQERIQTELGDALQRIGAQLGEVEQRQVDQLKRAVAREATRHAEAAGQQFIGAMQVLDRGATGTAIAMLEALENGAPVGYATLAKLQRANALLIAGDRREAINLYDAVAADTGLDKELRDLARLRQAIVLAEEKSYDEALKLLAEEPRHGYELIKAIEERMGGAYSPSPGVIYPTLTMLEELGYATVAETEGGKKLYAATPEGIAFLGQNKDTVEAIFQRMQSSRGSFAAPPILRAMENMKLALRMKLAEPELDEERIRKVAAAIDAAAVEIERA